jgi:hypothetical protein
MVDSNGAVVDTTLDTKLNEIDTKLNPIEFNSVELKDSGQGDPYMTYTGISYSSFFINKLFIYRSCIRRN